MGVQGLWELIDAVGHPVDLDTLANKVLAVDLSIWLNQSIKGIRDKSGRPVENAHVLGLFNRICKLLFYKIKPVFVFDGGVPALKKQTIAARHHQRAKAINKSKETTAKIIENYLASLMSDEMKDGNKTNSLDVTQLASLLMSANSNKSKDDDLFELPPIEIDIDDDEINPQSNEHDKAFIASSSSCEQDNKTNIKKLTEVKVEQYQDIDELDIISESFKCLPAEIRHELLTEMREIKKGWRRSTDPLPKESNDFCNYQMSRLLSRRKIQQEIENVEKELNEVSNKETAMTDLTKQQILSNNCIEIGRLSSDANTHYVLMKKPSNPPLTKDISQIDDEKLKLLRKIEVIEVEAKEDDKEVVKDESEDDLSQIEQIGIVNTIEVPSTSSAHIHVNRTIDLTDESNDSNIITADGLEEEIESQNNSSKKLHVISAIELSSDDEDEHEHEEGDDGDEDEVAIVEKVEERETEKCIDKKDEEKHDEESEKSEETDKEDEDVLVEVENANATTGNDSFPDDSFHRFITDLDEVEMVKLSQSNSFTSNANDEVVAIPVLPELKPSSNQPKDSESHDEVEPSIEVKVDLTAKPTVDPLFADIFLPREKTTQLKETTTSNAEPIPSTSKETQPSKSSSVEPVKPTASLAEMEKERIELLREKNKQDRFANVATNKMQQDCKDLLHLFGIPYVESPFEAEAQCARLEQLGLTQGTITDDSDVWLFGAQNVFKNFFTTAKFIEMFKLADIESSFGLTRSSLICIALLTGSDYTEGVGGVGVVKATEILSEFKGEELEPLEKFKQWWIEKKVSKDKRPENKIRASLMKLNLNDGFPNRVIYDAYMNPDVNNSDEKFTWSMPKLESLREYCMDKFGWTIKKADDTLLPIMKKVNEKQVQTRIDHFFKSSNQAKVVKANFTSKRLVNALDKMRSTDETSACEKTAKSSQLPLGKLASKVKNQRKRGNEKRKASETSSQASKAKKKQNAVNTKRSTKTTTRIEINLSESDSDSFSSS